MDDSPGEGNVFAIFDHLSEPIVVTDVRFKKPGPRIIYANGAFVSFCGRSSDELTRQPLSSIHTALQCKEQINTLKRASARRHACYAPGRLNIKGGDETHAPLHVAPLYPDDQHERLVCVVARDGERSDFISALQTNEKRYRDLFEHGHVGKAVIGLDGRFIDVNQSFCGLLGYERDELEGEHASLVIREQDRELVMGRLADIAEGKIPGYQNERQYVHKDGRTVTAMVDVMPERDDTGTVAAVVVQAQDISDLKDTEAGLRESEGRLRDFAEIAADWFWETDDRLVITYISHVHRQITGIPDDRIIGRTREELFRDNVYHASDPAVHLRTLNNYWDSMIEYSVNREDGRTVVVHDRASPFFDSEGNFRGYRGVGRDITEQKQLTERIAYQATRDALTGAVNRREFERCLDQALQDAHEQHSQYVLCFMDLNKFKPLNDTLGHAAGDYCLKAVVHELKARMAADDLLGRIGGDEFGILLRNTTTDEARRIALDIGRAIREHHFEWQNRTFSIDASIGLAPIDSSTRSTSELLARADAACYRAKVSSRDGVWLSDEAEAERLRTYTEVLRSLAGGSDDLSSNFVLVGQPICALADPAAGPAWYEVLLRLVGPDGELHRPHEFIHLAEQHGKMPIIDRWVLESAIAGHAALVKRVPDAILSINVASNSLNNERLQEAMDGMLESSTLRPDNICFEISEPSVITDMKPTIALVESLLERGYRVALDDFGSGPSSFEWLKSLPVHYLKLYGELVRDMREEGPDIAIIESMNELSRRLNLTLVAVQVETARTAELLRGIGVEFGQGEALASPLPLDELAGHLSDRACT